MLHFFCPSIPLPHKPRNNYYHILSCWADSLICVCFEIYFTFNTPNLTSGKSYAGWVWLCVCALVFRRLFSLPLLLLLFCLSLSLTRAHARTICTRPGNKRLSIKQNVEHDYMQPTHMVKLIPIALHAELWSSVCMCELFRLKVKNGAGFFSFLFSSSLFFFFYPSIGFFFIVVVLLSNAAYEKCFEVGSNGYWSNNRNISHSRPFVTLYSFFMLWFPYSRVWSSFVGNFHFS